MIGATVGKALVFTTEGGTHEPEVWAEMCVNRLISVADTAPQPIRDQAHAYRQQCKALITHYIREAIKADRQYR